LNKDHTSKLGHFTIHAYSSQPVQSLEGIVQGKNTNPKLVLEAILCVLKWACHYPCIIHLSIPQPTTVYTITTLDDLEWLLLGFIFGKKTPQNWIYG